MQKIVGLGMAALLAASAVGCATSARDEHRQAYSHRVRARDAASVGDYQTAAREQREAYKAEREAADKSVDAIDDGRAPPPVLPPQPLP